MKRLSIVTDIDNGIKAKKILAQLSEMLAGYEGEEITIDFKKVEFIAANHLSVLGAILDEFCEKKGCHVYISNLKPQVKRVMQKNGFGGMLGLEKVSDKFHTVIPYRRFTIDESLEFEKYLFINIFCREDIPLMSEAAKNTIIDNILEIFNNVKEHTSSNDVYACGQFFPKSSKLYFTVVDMGETIKENVTGYFKYREVEMEITNCIEWAIEEGNSTRIKGSPGGLGFSMLSRFVELNKGELSIVSDNECYEFAGSRYRTSEMEYAFKGTIVTVAINMSDSFSYLAINDSIEQIIF